MDALVEVIIWIVGQIPQVDILHGICLSLSTQRDILWTEQAR